MASACFGLVCEPVLLRSLWHEQQHLAGVASAHLLRLVLIAIPLLGGHLSDFGEVALRTITQIVLIALAEEIGMDRLVAYLVTAAEVLEDRRRLHALIHQAHLVLESTLACNLLRWAVVLHLALEFVGR